LALQRTTFVRRQSVPVPRSTALRWRWLAPAGAATTIQSQNNAIDISRYLTRLWVVSVFYKRVDRYPPVLVRLLARRPRANGSGNGTRPLTTDEIARDSGLTPAVVEGLSRSTTWKGVDIYTVRDFTVACGVDFTNPLHMKRLSQYLHSRGAFHYLRKNKQWDTYYRSLVAIWRSHFGKD